MHKTLRHIVSEIKFHKSWTVEQVAKSIGYSRVHLQKEMNKKEDNEHLKEKLYDAHKEILQNVSRGTDEKRLNTSANFSRAEVDYKEKYIAILEKQNELNLKEIKDILLINHGLLTALFEELVTDPKKNKLLSEQFRKHLHKNL